jgi:hypothetical protein
LVDNAIQIIKESLSGTLASFSIPVHRYLRFSQGRVVERYW